MKRYTYLFLVTALLFLTNACKEIENGNTKSYPGPDYVGFDVETITSEETAGEVTLTVLSSNPNGASATIAASSEDAVAGVDYTLGATSVTFAAGEFQKEVTVTLIDNEEIDGQKSVTFSLTSDDAQVGLSGNSPDLVLTINDDDFYCPANKLQITQGTDVGYSTAAASVATVAAPGDECTTFLIVGGAASLFGQQIDFAITVVPDGEESNTGTIKAESMAAMFLPDGTEIGNTIDIVADDSGFSGTASYFDLTTGEFGFDYVLYNGSGAALFGGRLEFE
ncbi:Calx-beta domain-containing protein [Ekhidna sp.]|uniref:Calx-beta domain-containing protein n=1 Tax=Ekhidna sp. TaxID=2608089 RepID=UPI003B59955A